MIGEKAGYIYIMINASFPKDLLKIGYTKRDPEIRADELSQNTGLPSEYIVAYDKLVCDCELAERLIHDKLKNSRSTTFRNDRSREFFKIKFKDAVKAIDSICDEIGIVDEEAAEVDDKVEGKKIRSERIYQKALNEKIPGMQVQFMSEAARLGNNDAIKWLKGRRPLVEKGVHNLQTLRNPEIEKDSAQVIKIVEESVKIFQSALEITIIEIPNYEIYNWIGLAYSYVVRKNHKFKTRLDMATLISYQELSIKYLLLSIKENPQTGDGYEFLVTRYLSYNDWSKKKKAVEMLNKAKELNPNKAEEYEKIIHALEKEEL
jgi:tetratricopeptide (TPR) repeat protein